MKQYVIAMVGLMAIDFLSKMFRLHRGNTHYPVWAIVADCVVCVMLGSWGVWVLASQGKQ